jgi:ribonuclease VapC
MTVTIAVDTSALMAIILNETMADDCIAALTAATSVFISAGTVAEALIVAAHRNVAGEMAKLIDAFGFDVEAVTATSARRIAAAYARWGKGIHPAGLNFGDCFAYEVARQHDCPLLFVGDDFSRTDVQSAL